MLNLNLFLKNANEAVELINAVAAVSEKRCIYKNTLSSKIEKENDCTAKIF